MAIFFGLYTSYNSGALIADYSARLTSLEFSTNEHGFAGLSAVVPMAQAEAYRLYDRPGLPHVVVMDAGAVAWEGRLEDVAIIAGGIRLSAFGYWRALSDAPVTALWSQSGVANFKTATEIDQAARAPNMYTMDNNNRLFVGLTKSACYMDSAAIGTWYSSIPHNSVRQISTFSFDYVYDLPASWVFRANSFLSGFASGSVLNITTSGGTGSGTLSWSLCSLRDMVAIDVYNATGASSLYSGESASKYARATNVRITTSGSKIYANEIISSIAASISGLNASQLNSSSALIDNPGLDLPDQVYIDEYPSTILPRLAALGDTQSPPVMWEVGVYEQQLLFFRQRGSAGRTWYVDVDDLEVERTIDALANAARAQYQLEDGTLQRTASSVNNDSVARYGLTRSATIGADTSSSTMATAQRDTFLQDRKDPIPHIRLNLTRLNDASGALWPKWSVRSGDTLTIRNLPPTLSTTIDRIRTFRVAETMYNADTDTIEVTPESPTPRLETLLARAAGHITEFTGATGAKTLSKIGGVFIINSSTIGGPDALA